MVDTGIFATTAEVQRKTGAGASATANTEAYINDYMTQAESLINTTCKYNFSDTYSALNVDVKGILKSAASSWAAMKVIQFDMSGYTSRTEARMMLNVLYDDFTKCITELKEKDKQSFIIGA